MAIIKSYLQENKLSVCHAIQHTGLSLLTNTVRHDVSGLDEIDQVRTERVAGQNPSDLQVENSWALPVSRLIRFV